MTPVSRMGSTRSERPLTHKQKVLALLSDCRPHSHHELYRLGCIAHSRVADLRRDGHDILAWREHDSYIYQLVSLDAAVSAVAAPPLPGVQREASPADGAAASNEPNPDQLDLWMAA